MSEENPFKYTVTEKPRPKRVEMVCENCGSTNVEAAMICTWNFQKQRWESTNNEAGLDDYCQDCDCETSINTREVGC
jgi:hypothetical protein